MSERDTKNERKKRYEYIDQWIKPTNGPKVYINDNRVHGPSHTNDECECRSSDGYLCFNAHIAY